MLDKELVLLDSEDRSVSVAEARHMARKNMLVPALDKLFEMGMNGDNRTIDRYNCLKFVVEFAAEAQGEGTKTIGRLSPQAAKLIAKLGIANAQASTTINHEPGNGGVSQDAPEEERVGRRGVDDNPDDNDD